MTFLFTDIEESTAAWDRHPSEMRDASARHDSIVRDAVVDEGGYVFSTMGDGFAAAFPTAPAAMRAAVAAQRALAVERWPEPVVVKVRMGLHTGATVERDGDYFGPNVIRAARLMSLVGGGRIVCSAATAGAVGTDAPSDVDLVPVGTVALKGLADAEDVYAVSGAGLAETGAKVGLLAGSISRVPTYVGPLLGREDEVAAVTSALRTTLLTTITGTAGVGKTRLAAEACRLIEGELREGIVWVDLATVSRGDDVTQVVADALGVSPAPGERLSARIAAALQGRSAVIVLDNCEHVAATVAALVHELLAAQGTARILATSRERLGGNSESIVELTPLESTSSDSPAVRLLAYRIGPQAAGSRDQLRELAGRLDGVPLALELAAARCRTIGVASVLDRVDKSFNVLIDDKEDLARHRSLAAALEWSFQLLSDREQRLLRALSLFASEFDLDGAQRLGAAMGLDPGATDATVASLVDRSLISRTASRFRLLTPTRDFARSVGQDDPTSTDLEAAYAAHVTQRSHTIHDGLRGADEQRWLDELDSLWPDVRAVVRRAFDHDDLDTIAYLVPLFVVVDAFWRRPEAHGWAAEAAARYGDAPAAGRHKLLAVGSIAAWVEQNIPLAVELAERALAADPLPGTGDCDPEAAAIAAYNFAGRFTDAADVARTCLERVSARGDLYSQAYMAANLGLSLAIGGLDAEEATASAAHAVRTARALGNQTILSYALFAAVMAAGDDADMASAATREARAVALAAANRWVLLVTIGLEAATAPSGQVELATVLATVDTLYRSGWVAHAWTLLGGIARHLFALDRDEDAAVVVGACEASDVATFKQAELPAASRDALVNDPKLVECRRLGAHLSIPELLRSLTAS